MDLGYQYEKVILGSSYCSGFVDSSGRWNSGFYCPETEELISVFCCGSSTDKYCCTKADQKIADDGEKLSNTVTMVLVSLFIILLVVTSISLIFCSSLHGQWWRRSRKFLDKWQLSRVDTSDTCTPGSTSCDQFLPATCSRDSFRSQSATCFQPQTQVILSPPLDNTLTMVKHHDVSRPPPPYNILPLGSYIIVPQDAPDLICESQASVSSNPDQTFLAVDTSTRTEDFFSTKF